MTNKPESAVEAVAWATSSDIERSVSGKAPLSWFAVFRGKREPFTEPLYSAATVAELRAKADAAERRVGELEVALRDLIEDVQHPDHDAGDWSERVCIRNAQATLTGADPT